MAEPRIASLNALKQYILRRLGYPAHNIEITDEQLDDAISDTLDDFTLNAYSGYMERYIPIQLISGVQDYILPYDIFAVLSVNDANMSMIGSNMPTNMFSMNQFIAADLYRPGVAKIDLVGYEMINQLTASIDLVFARKQTFDFNSVSKILHLHAVPTADPSFNKVVLQVYRKLDLTTTPVTSGQTVRYQEENVYDERWVKRMATAKAKLQWGINIGLKYQGSTLPNGGSINGQGIIDQATLEIEALNTELEEKYTLPIDFFVG